MKPTNQQRALKEIRTVTHQDTDWLQLMADELDSELAEATAAEDINRIRRMGRLLSYLSQITISYLRIQHIATNGVAGIYESPPDCRNNQ